MLRDNGLQQGYSVNKMELHWYTALPYSKGKPRMSMETGTGRLFKCQK